MQQGYTSTSSLMTIRQLEVEKNVRDVISIRAIQQHAEFPNKNTTIIIKI